MKIQMLALLFAGAVAHADSFPYTCEVRGQSHSPDSLVYSQPIYGVGATAEDATKSAVASCTLIFSPQAQCDFITCSNTGAPPANPGSFVLDGLGVVGNDNSGAAAECQKDGNRICAQGHKKAKLISAFSYYGENGNLWCSDPSDPTTCTSVYYTAAEGTFTCN